MQILYQQILYQLSYQGSPNTVLHSGCTINTNSTEGSLSSTYSPTLVIYCLFDNGYSSKCEVILHCDCDFHFPNSYWCWVPSCTYWPSICLYWKKDIQIFCITSFTLFVVIELCELFIYVRWNESHSVVSDSATPWTIQSMASSRPEYWSISLLHGIFPSQESNWGILHCRRILYHLSYQGTPIYIKC